MHSLKSGNLNLKANNRTRIFRINLIKMKYEETTGKIIGCSMEVHRNPGPGFQEYIYHRALAKEFKLQGVQFVDEYEIKIYYKGDQIGLSRADFYVGHQIPVEIKAITD